MKLGREKIHVSQIPSGSTQSGERYPRRPYSPFIDGISRVRRQLALFFCLDRHLASQKQ